MPQSLERITDQEFSFEPSRGSFSQDVIGKICAVMPTAEIVQAMYSANSQLPPGTAERIIGAEQGRVRMLGPHFHPRFYELPLELLLEKEVIASNQWFGVELGPSLLAHWAGLDRHLTPRMLRAFDKDPHIVAGAQVAVNTFRQVGLFPTGDFQTTKGDQSSRLEQPADVAIASLLSQYDAGPAALKWLEANGRVGINGELMHTGTALTSDELGQLQQLDTGQIDSLVLPIRSKKAAVVTGFGWELTGPPRDNQPFGMTYQAELVLDHNRIGEGKDIVHLPVKDDVYHTTLTVYQSPRGTEYRAWGVEPTDLATDDDKKEVAGFWHTLEDIWASSLPGQEPWDANVAWAFPALASEDKYFTAVMVTTVGTGIVPIRLPWVMIKKEGRKANLLQAQGLLSQVGKGRAFQDLDDLDARLSQWLAPTSLFDQKFKLVNPALLTTITTNNSQAFQRLTSQSN